MTNQSFQQPESAEVSASWLQVSPAAVLINREVAQKVLATVDAGLCAGIGERIPGQMCVQAAVCYALGLPDDDDPRCVVQSLRKLEIRLNDASWSSPAARASGLRRLALAQLGTKDVIDEGEFARRVLDIVITNQVPLALNTTPASHTYPTVRASLKYAADKCKSSPTCKEVRYARDLVMACKSGGLSRSTNAVLEVLDAVLAAGEQMGRAYWRDVAKNAASAAIAAARAVYVEVRTAGRAGEADHARDGVLAAFAEDVVQVLSALGAPGCQWLTLTEAA